MTVDQLTEQSLQHLAADSLLPFIEWWDLLYLQHDESCTDLLREGFVRMTLALAETLATKPGSPVERTLSAASNYLKEPTEPNWSDFIKASTNSYPFGPGDGCYGIEAIGHGSCGPGSGCRSGIGFVFFVSSDRALAQECLRTAFKAW